MAGNLVWQYSVKFICGVANIDSRIAIAKYWTNINIHNPWDISLPIIKKVAQATFESFPQIPPSPPVIDTINPDWAMMVESADIKKIAGITDPDMFVEGFLVIQSSKTLDVSAVYTSQTDSGQVTLDVQDNIIPKLVPAILPTT